MSTFQVIYIVEWRCRKSGAAGHTVCQKTHEVVSNMPLGSTWWQFQAVMVPSPPLKWDDGPRFLEWDDLQSIRSMVLGLKVMEQMKGELLIPTRKSIRKSQQHHIQFL